MSHRISNRLLTGGLLGLVVLLGSLTASSQVHVVHHVVHHGVHVVPHSVVVYGPCCLNYPYHPHTVHHVYHAYHPYHPYHVHHLYHVYHPYHVYHVYHVYHPYPIYNVYDVHHSYCCPQHEVYDALGHERAKGYRDGFDRGKDDASDARVLDPNQSHRYRGSRSVAYRDAFVQGYEAGYHNYTY